jgi:DnaJ-class molecular chaperone
MKEYHPDKVEMLGSKIKEVAAKELKNLNAAYSMLKKNGNAQ